MGRPYGHQYFYAGSGSRTGTMICAGCDVAIDPQTQDWMSYKKTKSYDWSYVCWHRECRADPQWAKLDARREQSVRDLVAMQADAAAFVAKWSKLGRSLSEYVADIEERECAA
jgi:hypothetical protein